MGLTIFREVFLPYVLRKDSEGKWVVLNREYLPIGFKERSFETPSPYPKPVTIKGLTKELILQLSCDGVFNGESLYLYDDRTDPTMNDENFKKYLERIRVLQRLEVK
jgi:hypothetical protein